MNVFIHITEFNREIIGIEQRPLGLLNKDEVEFTSKALNEEREEFVHAHESGDFIGAIDALLDSIYFAVGGLYKMGLSPEQMAECMMAVHNANMTKKKGITKRGHENDAIKPEGWMSPEERIGKILDGE